MIPIIHVIATKCTEVQEIKTSFFIFKETSYSNYYHIIGEYVFGKSREDFFLFVTRSGVKSYIKSLYYDKIHISLITMYEEYLASCPTWNYTEIRRRVSASSLYLLSMPEETDDNTYLLKNYLNIIENSDFASLNGEDYDWDQWNKWSNWEDVNHSDNWRGEDY